MADNGPSAAQESTPLNDFGNNFGNKAVVLPQSLIKLLTMAEREGKTDKRKNTIIPFIYKGFNK